MKIVPYMFTLRYQFHNINNKISCFVILAYMNLNLGEK
jgi:hypothetical protein